MEQSISSDKFNIPTIGDSLLDSPTWLLATVLPTAFHRGYSTVGWYLYWQPAAVRLFRKTFDDGRFQSTVRIFFRFTIIGHFQSAISGWTPRLGFLRLDTPLRSVVCWPVGLYTDVWQPVAVRPFRSTFDDGRFQSTVRIFCAVTIIRYFQSNNFNFDSIICWD